MKCGKIPIFHARNQHEPQKNVIYVLWCICVCVMMMMKCFMFYICCSYVIEGLFHTKTWQTWCVGFFFLHFFKKTCEESTWTTFLSSLSMFIYEIRVFFVFSVFFVFFIFFTPFRCKKCKEIFLRTLINNSCPLGY